MLDVVVAFNTAAFCCSVLIRLLCAESKLIMRTDDAVIFPLYGAQQWDD